VLSLALGIHGKCWRRKEEEVVVVVER